MRTLGNSFFLFGCEDAAQQVLMSSVCVSVPHIEILRNTHRQNQYKTVQDSTRQYKTVQDSTKQYKTVQDSTKQYKTVQDSTRKEYNANEFHLCAFLVVSKSKLKL